MTSQLQAGWQEGLSKKSPNVCKKLPKNDKEVFSRKIEDSHAQQFGPI